MRKIFQFTFILGLFLGAKMSAIAEPSEVTRFLMNTPVSLMTRGLENIKIDIQSLQLPPGYVTIAGYDWDTDRFQITLACVGSACDDNASEQTCALRLNQIRTKAGITDGKISSWLPHSLFAENFKQNGHQSPQQPNNWGTKIDQKIALKVILGWEQPIICEAPLIGSGYSLSRQ